MVKENLRVTILQTNILWEKASHNRTAIQQMVSALNFPVDIIVLPEMFTTGFSSNISLAETMQGETIIFLKNIASTYDCAVCGSLIIKENGSTYNRFVFVEPDGSITTYDKRHLFGLGGEKTVYSRGVTQVTIPFRGWRIRPLICYDLRFPVWSRNTDNYDLLLYVANWPASRNSIWNTLLSARAIENQCFVVGANRCGSDGMGIEYVGNSRIVDPKGDLLSVSENEPTHCSFTFNYSWLKQFREKFPFLDDRDEFTMVTS